ncbi:MAG: DUF3748 domain-containing protein [Pirellulales bacterium]
MRSSSRDALAASERQLTFDPYNHDLDNNDCFSPDDRFLVYDTRAIPDGIGANGRIEKVELATGEPTVLYETTGQTADGPGVGAASYHPSENRVVFIHGLTNCDASRPYAQWRRTGVMVDEADPGVPVFLDARDVTAPFTPGALRGGTHCHEWSGDGHWIGFTYNDALLAEIEERTGESVNLRTIGVATDLGAPVAVDHDADGENNDGLWFTALVVKVVPHPQPGSDEVSRAFSDSWVGQNGYLRADGTRQQRARAFLGTTRDADGNELVELFVVDIPDRIDRPGDDGPLGGTSTTMPGVVAGAQQRRLTRTVDWPNPGVATEPRHWVRSSPDGEHIGFLARDDAGVIQVFFASPRGGEPQQVTHHAADVQCGPRFNTSGTHICYVADNQLQLCDIRPGNRFGRSTPLTARTDAPPTSPVWSHHERVIAVNRLVDGPDGTHLQIFLCELADGALH